MRITRVTTRTGDGGKTRLGNGKEVTKSDLRIRCIGLIDELNSFIGHSKVILDNGEIFSNIEKIQNQLLNLGGELSMPGKNLELIKKETISFLDDIINTYNNELPPLKEFILPGDDEFSSRLHLARSVCRRAETKITELYEKESGNKLWIQYLNRLSDYLFVTARFHLFKSEITEKQWNRID